MVLVTLMEIIKRIFLHNKKITDNIFKSLKKSKIDYFQCVSSSCVYRDSGPSRISEKMRLRGKPEKANLGYGMAKRYLENKIKIAAKKINLIYLLCVHSIYMETDTNGLVQKVKQFQCLLTKL